MDSLKKKKIVWEILDAEFWLEMTEVGRERKVKWEKGETAHMFYSYEIFIVPNLKWEWSAFWSKKIIGWW